MIKGVRYKGILLCGLLPSFAPDEDEFEKYKEIRGLYITDPWERVKSIFSKNDHGESHPEFKYATEMFKIGTFVGATYGGIVNALSKSEDYRNRNDANIFASNKEAIKAYASNNLLSFVNGAAKLAIPFGVFFFGFSIVSSCCEAYNNKARVIDSSIAGVAMGSLSRFFYGIKGMISGGVVGGILGTFYGLSILVLSKLGNTNQVELKYAQFAFQKYRQRFLSDAGASLEEDKIITNSGLHSIHTKNPLDEFSDETNNTENGDKTNNTESSDKTNNSGMMNE